MDRSIVGLGLILGLAIALAIGTGRYLRWVFRERRGAVISPTPAWNACCTGWAASVRTSP